AVVGTSRLPLTSVEAPLPAFSFGRLYYGYRGGNLPHEGPLRTWRELLQVHPGHLQSHPACEGHWMETFLRTVPAHTIPEAAEEVLRQGVHCALIPRQIAPVVPETTRLLDVLYRMYNGVSLSPWTDLTEKALSFVRAWQEVNSIPRERPEDAVWHR